MITTHVLDLSIGRPAGGVRVSLARVADGARTVIGTGVTDADGRLRTLMKEGQKLEAGIFELTFETGTYFANRGVQSFHPHVVITVQITEPKQHYHVPLLVSPFGYTTYRGS